MKSLKKVLEKAKQNKSKTLVVAAAEDNHVLEAVKQAVSDNIIKAILVGNKAKINSISKEISFDITNIEIVNEQNSEQSCTKAVELINSGKADFLMKGLVGTATLLKAVLDKENGLRKEKLLSHVAFFETKYYHKLLCVTDAAMNIEPKLEAKAGIIKNAVDACRALGVSKPKVSVVAAVEFVNPKMQATVDAAELKAMNKKGEIKDCIVDGPLALDISISKEAAKHKGIKGEVAGDADILLMHDINVGNVFYKSLNFLGGAVSGAVIMGAKVPIVLTSRADSEESKLLSIAVAAAMNI